MKGKNDVRAKKWDPWSVGAEMRRWGGRGGRGPGVGPQGTRRGGPASVGQDGAGSLPTSHSCSPDDGAVVRHGIGWA